MKNLVFVVINCLLLNSVCSQVAIPENFGNPTGLTSLNGYAGFSKPTQQYYGTAMIDNQNPSYIPTSVGTSGGGNVFFNTPNANLTIKNIKGAPHRLDNTVNPITVIGLQFHMLNADTNNLADFKAEISFDSINYHRMKITPAYSSIPSWYNPNGWSIMQATVSLPQFDLLQTSFDSTKLSYRFTQNSIAKQYRIDDIYLYYVGILNNKNFTLNAQKQFSHTKLSWQSINSSFGDCFEVEKSINDGFYYQKIGTQKVVALNKNAMYDFFDTDNSNTNFVLYRIKLVNANGEVQYSNVQKITAKASANIISSLYPTIANYSFNVNVQNKSNDNVAITVKNIYGIQVYLKTIEKSNQIASLIIPTKNLPNGIYWVTAINGQLMETKKILIQH